jgi:hypothetical protein
VESVFVSETGQFRLLSSDLLEPSVLTTEPDYKGIAKVLFYAATGTELSITKVMCLLYA